MAIQNKVKFTDPFTGTVKVQEPVKTGTVKVVEPTSPNIFVDFPKVPRPAVTKSIIPPTKIVSSSETARNQMNQTKLQGQKIKSMLEDVAKKSSLVGQEKTPEDISARLAEMKKEVIEKSSLGIPKPSEMPIDTTSVVPTGITSTTELVSPESPEFKTEIDAVAQAKTKADEALEKLKSSLSGKFTQEEQQKIEDVVSSIKSQFDTLITGAKREKDIGTAQALIAAGRVGGFQGTQFAGQAALGATEAPTTGELPFFGAGGSLEFLKSSYDQNISDIENEQISAMNQAKYAAEQAIQTGDEKFLNLAENAYKQAQDVYNQKLEITRQYQADIESIKKSQQDTATFYAPSLIQFDENQRPIMPSNQTISDYAQSIGFDKNILKAAIAKEYQNAMQIGANMYKKTIQSKPATIQEYEYAQSQGFKGSLIEYQQQKKGTVDLDEGTIDFLASKFLIDGKLPAFGFGAAGAKARGRFYQNVAQQAESQGLSGSAVAAQQASTRSLEMALNQTQKNGALVRVASGKAQKQIEIVRDLIDQVDNTGIPAFNRWLNAGRKSIAGDPTVAKFNQAIQTLQFEYGKVASGAVGIGGVTVSSQEEVNDSINSSMSPEQLHGLLDQISLEIERADSAYSDEVEGLKIQISNTGTGLQTTPQTFPTPSGIPTPSGGDLDSIWQ